MANAINVNLSAVPLAYLTPRSRQILAHLNRIHVLPSDRPWRRLRDWRGLATLANITAQQALYIENLPDVDKITKVIEIWSEQGVGAANVKSLLQFLQMIDRGDVHDDLVELYNKNEFIEFPEQDLISEEDLITIDDRSAGFPQHYNGLVLYAKEDENFALDVIEEMTRRGLKLCTEEALIKGQRSRHEPLMKLIRERCDKLLLIISPAFFSEGIDSRFNSYFVEYTRSLSIEKEKVKIIPIIYREIEQVSELLSYVTPLRYTRPGERAVFDFNYKLEMSLRTIPPRHRYPQLLPPQQPVSAPLQIQAAQSSINISEMAPSYTNGSVLSSGLLSLPGMPNKSASMTNVTTGSLPMKLPIPDSKSLSKISHESERKKTSLRRKLAKLLKIGKKKDKGRQAVMVES